MSLNAFTKKKMFFQVVKNVETTATILTKRFLKKTYVFNLQGENCLCFVGDWIFTITFKIVQIIT